MKRRCVSNQTFPSITSMSLYRMVNDTLSRRPNDLSPLLKIENVPHTQSQVQVPPMLVYVCASMWIINARLPCWPSRGQQVSYHRWIWGMQTRKHTSKESTLALKPRVDPGKSITLVLVDKQKELMSSKFFVKNKKENNSPYVCHSNAGWSRTSRWRRHHLCIFCNFLNNPLKVKKYDPYKSYVNEKPPPPPAPMDFPM